MSLNPFKIYETFRIVSVYSQTLDDLDSEFILSINHSIHNLIKERLVRGIKKNITEWRLAFYKEPNHQIPLLYAIIDISRKMVSSGKYHTYRGVLSMDGTELVEIFDRAAEILIENKKISKKDFIEAKKELLEDIEMVG